MVLMELCRECGVPAGVAKNHAWNPNGTISLPKDDSFRMVILEVEMIRALVSSLKGIIGDYTDRIILEGKRRNVKHFVDNLLVGMKGVLGRSVIGRKKVYGTLIGTGLEMGYGRAVLEEYRAKELLSGTVHNCYCPALFAGDLSGAFESVERVDAEVTWEEVEMDVRFTVERAEKPSDYQAGLHFEPVEALPGKATHVPCPRCGVPLKLRDYEWNSEQGSITDPFGQRVFLIGLNDLNVVVRGLEAAIGEEVPGLIESTNREQARKLVEAGGVKEFSDLIGIWRLHGLGNITRLESSGEMISLWVENPYNIHLIRGRLGGTYESLTGKAPRIEISDKIGHLEIGIRSD